MSKIFYSIIIFCCGIAFPILRAEDYSFTGDIEGKIKVSVMSQDWGSIIWLIENGANVKKGEVVAKMDPTREQERLDASKDSLDKMKEDLKNIQKDLENAYKEEEVKVSQAKLERDLAKVKWEIAKEGVYGIVLSRLQTDIANAKINYEQKKLAYTTTQKLYDGALVDERTYQQSKLDLELAEIDVLLAQNTLAIQRRDSENAEKLAHYEFEIKETQYQKAEMSKLNRIQSLKFNVDKKNESITNLEDSIKKSELRVSNLILTASQAGIATYKIRNGKLVQVGDRVGRGFAILDILYRKRKKILIEIEEKHILKFKIGDEATIKVADTGEITKGHITSISTTPRDKNESLGPVGKRVSGYSGITVFEVEVSFDDPEGKYKYGFTTVVTFQK